jgi:hypothetical protein
MVQKNKAILTCCNRLDASQQLVQLAVSVQAAHLPCAEVAAGQECEGDQERGKHNTSAQNKQVI